MNTPEQNSPLHQMPVSKTKFIEYSIASPGQHFITVVRDKTVLGRIYREFDSTTKKTVYTAKDEHGYPIFMNESTLSGIKTRFARTHKVINASVQDQQDSMEEEDNIDKTTLKVAKSESINERESEMQKLREHKNAPEKKNVINR